MRKWDLYNNDYGFLYLVFDMRGTSFPIDSFSVPRLKDMRINVKLGVSTMTIEYENDVAKYKVVILSLLFLHISYGWMANRKEYDKNKMMEALK